MTRKDIPYYVLFGTLALIFLILLMNRKPPSDDPCELQRELFNTELTSATVIEKVIEKENHALKKVVIKNEDKTYDLLFIPYDNWRDFEDINVGDSVSKAPRSFTFKINNKREIRLEFECGYMK